MSQELIENIQRLRADGNSDSLIVHQLQKVGYDENEIVHAFRSLQGVQIAPLAPPQQFPPPPRATKPRLKIKKRFVLILLIGVMLILTGILLQDPIGQKIASIKPQSRSATTSPSPTTLVFPEKFAAYQSKLLGQSIELKPGVVLTITHTSKEQDRILQVHYLVENKNTTEQRIFDDSNTIFQIVNKSGDIRQNTSATFSEGIEELHYLEPKQTFSSALRFEIPSNELTDANLYLIVSRPIITPNNSIFHLD